MCIINVHSFICEDIEHCPAISFLLVFSFSVVPLFYLRDMKECASSTNIFFYLWKLRAICKKKVEVTCGSKELWKSHYSRWVKCFWWQYCSTKSIKWRLKSNAGCLSGAQKSQSQIAKDLLISVLIWIQECEVGCIYFSLINSCNFEQSWRIVPTPTLVISYLFTRKNRRGLRASRPETIHKWLQTIHKPNIQQMHSYSPYCHVCAVWNIILRFKKARRTFTALVRQVSPVYCKEKLEPIVTLLHKNQLNHHSGFVWISGLCAVACSLRIRRRNPIICTIHVSINESHLFLYRTAEEFRSTDHRRKKDQVDRVRVSERETGEFQLFTVASCNLLPR